METGKSDVLDKIEKINKKDSALQYRKGYQIEHDLNAVLAISTYTK